MALFSCSGSPRLATPHTPSRHPLAHPAHLCSSCIVSSYSKMLTTLLFPRSAALKATRRRRPSASCARRQWRWHVYSLSRSGGKRGGSRVVLSPGPGWDARCSCCCCCCPRCHPDPTALRNHPLLPPSCLLPHPHLHDPVVRPKVLILTGHAHGLPPGAQVGGGQLVGQVALQGVWVVVCVQ